MKTRDISRHLAKACVAVLSLVFTLGSFSSLAASTDISDVPLAVKNGAKPNIMFILDNSGSMVWESLNGEDATAEQDDNRMDFYSNSVNQLYYDPNTRYTPGIDKGSFSSTTPNGTSMANADITPTGALQNPYSTSTSRTNLMSTCYYKTYNTNPKLLKDSGNCVTSKGGAYQNGPIALTAFYYEYTGTGTPTPGSSNSYVRRDIISTNAPFTRNATRTDCTVSNSTASCTFNQELQNFANWYSYYRTRILTMKTTMGQAFAGLSSKYRVGFSTINDALHNGNPSGENFLAIKDFDLGVGTTAGAKETWFNQLYSINPDRGTPLQKALARVGEYYSGNTMGYVNSAKGTDNPVHYKCQSNYAILSTDGYWNSYSGNEVSVGYSGSGNADKTVFTLPVSDLSTPPVTGLVSGSLWPRPYYEGPTASINTLADVAAHYWLKDLRTDLENVVPVSTADPASWQHMTTFTIGLGANGTETYREDYLTATSGFYKDVVDGKANWPKPVQQSKSSIDDLWHAAVNGHGQYFSAKSPAKLLDSLRKILEDIVSRTGSAAAVAVANADVTLDNTSYASKYNSGNWSGDLLSYPIDIATGIPSSTSTWSAKALLDAAGVTASTRKIVSYSGVSGSGHGVQFQPVSATTATKLTTAQQDFLNSTTSPPGLTDGADVLAFLRGDRSKETTAYRTRASRLGDIVNSEPVVVATPPFKYNDDGYAAYKAAQSTTATNSPPFTPTRIKTVFQGANDGMLHAFNASNGQESWAYIPNLLFDGPSKLRDLSKLISFSHQYYVDGTPTVGDVDFSNTCPDAGCPRPDPLSTADWRSILVGGLGKGGRGYYALDVTTPTASSEADAATKVMWEFPNSATTGRIDLTTTSGANLVTSPSSGGLVMNANKIGFTNGTPRIVKTKAHGWVALVSSGYNNGVDTGGDGHGYLFVLNARTGVLLHVFDTGVGSTSSPSGLTHISAFVEDSQVDNTVQYVYGGDLLGNVWRFDLNDVSTSNWKLKKLATLVDAQSTPVVQPVTTPPELAKIVVRGTVKRFVYVGTGQYLGDSDIPGASGANTHASQTQTMYGLVDDLSNPSGATAVISPLRSNLGQQTFTPSGSLRTATKTYVDLSSKKGWYIDLTVTGERIFTNPVLSVGALVFTSNIPNSDVCSPGGSSWLNILDYQNGGMLTGLTSASWSLGNVLASRPILIQLGDGTIKVLVRDSGANTQSLTGPGSGKPTATRRISWKEILNN